jgi:hypothetical protein
VNSDYRQGNPYAQQDSYSAPGNPYQQSTGYSQIPSGNGGSYGSGYGENEYEMNTYGGGSQGGNSLTDFFAEVHIPSIISLLFLWQLIRSAPK